MPATARPLAWWTMSMMISTSIFLDELRSQIVALCERLNERRIHFRRAQPSPLVDRKFATSPTTWAVDRDRAVSGLANKAVNTYRAIGLLVEQGLADDGYALCRVLMENAITLAWISEGDWQRRIDTFVFFAAPTQKRYRTVLLDHYPADSEIATAAVEAWLHQTGLRMCPQQSSLTNISNGHASRTP
jgi:hypothetical protein